MKAKIKSGFSLIEVAIAMLVLVVVMLGGAAMLTRTGVSIWTQGKSRIAIEIVNQELEIASGNDFNSLASTSKTITRNGVNYLVQTVVTDILSGFQKQIDVSVSWQNESVSGTTLTIRQLSIMN